MILTEKVIRNFSLYLQREEKSRATQEKYLRDVNKFYLYASNGEITKELVVAWKRHLIGAGYAARSVNSMLASVNCLLDYIGRTDCKAKNLRIQQKPYCTEDKELTKKEYLRLLAAAKGNEQLSLVIQTICGTGIRVSELKFFTVETVRRGEVTVECKSKTRTILIPRKLKQLLLEFHKTFRNGGVTYTYQAAADQALCFPTTKIKQIKN